MDQRGQVRLWRRKFAQQQLHLLLLMLVGLLVGLSLG
jgi:hypothetical protein